MDSLYLCFHGDQSTADSNKISGRRLFRRYVILFGQTLFPNNYRESVYLNPRMILLYMIILYYIMNIFYF